MSDALSAPPSTCACPRSRQQLRRREELSLGRKRVIYQFQCLDCGAGHGIWARAPKRLNLPEWDDSLPCSDDVELEEPEVAAWWESYREYLRSGAWEAKRERVFERERDLQRRADPLCQACWKRPGQQVHHLSYKRLRNEPLVDLVLCCERCHAELHARMSASD